MIPLRDVIPSRTAPYITVALVVLNTLAWVVELALPRDVLRAYLQTYGAVPATRTGPTLVTSMFLHDSWSHAVGNVWYLWIFGENVEDWLGHARFAVFYLLCGVIASLAQTAVDPRAPFAAVGASGAVSGVMGAYFVLYPRSRVLTLVPLIVTWEIIEVPAVLLLGFWFVVQRFSVGTIAATADTRVGAIVAVFAGLTVGAAAAIVFRRRVDRWKTSGPR